MQTHVRMHFRSGDLLGWGSVGLEGDSALAEPVQGGFTFPSQACCFLLVRQTRATAPVTAKGVLLGLQVSFLPLTVNSQTLRSLQAVHHHHLKTPKMPPPNYLHPFWALSPFPLITARCQERLWEAPTPPP